MSTTTISDFIKNMHLLVLPSTLWGVHCDPHQNFIAIVHLNVSINKMEIDKGILVASPNSPLKTCVFINNEEVQVPDIACKIGTISKLSSLLDSLHELRFCLNTNCNPKCLKYALNKASAFCDNCTKGVDSDSTYLEDIQLSLEEDNFQFPDEHCNKPEEKKFLCSVCGQIFKNRSDLRHHNAVHLEEKPHKCNICAKTFRKKYNLNVHIRVHSGERPYICSKCGKTYATSSNLSTHMSSAHLELKKHPCEICKMTFVHPRMLRIHMRKHTGEKPYMCQICGKVFAKNVHLTIHTRTHTGEKPYICPVCGKGFTTTGNLNSHRKMNNHKL